MTVAAQVRASTGVTAEVLDRGASVPGSVPWLGLVLWALACGGLFVSLVLRPPELWADASRAADTSTKVVSELATSPSAPVAARRR